MSALLVSLIAGLGALIASVAAFLAVGAYRQVPAGAMDEQMLEELEGLPQPSRLVRKAQSTLEAMMHTPPQPGLQLELGRAGIDSAHAVELYLSARAAFAFFGSLFATLYVRPSTPAEFLWATILPGIVGYSLPWLWLLRRRSRRRAAMIRFLPNALDMLVSCVESGMGLHSALDRVAVELVGVCVPLARELELVVAQNTAGIPREQALQELGTRTGLQQLAELASVLTHAERYGGEIATALRNHAEMTRRERALDAERIAQEAGPKLSVIMVLFVFPALFVILIGPAMINVATRLLPHIAG